MALISWWLPGIKGWEQLNSISSDTQNELYQKARAALITFQIIYWASIILGLVFAGLFLYNLVMFILAIIKSSKDLEPEKFSSEQEKEEFEKWKEQKEFEERKRRRGGEQKLSEKEKGCPRCGKAGWRVLCPNCKNN